jgi:hypothetical protein
LRTTQWDGPNFIETYYNFDQRYKFVYKYIDSIGDESCVRNSLTDREFEEYTKKTGYLFTADQYFKIQPNERYQGVREVRGILSDYWISNQIIFTYNGNSNYVKVHHYFAVQHWNMNIREVEESIPIRVVFEGYFRNNTGKYPFHLQLDVIDYFSGADSIAQPDLFVPPSSANCPVIYELPFPVLPKKYQATIQLNRYSEKYTQTYVVYNDLINGNTRFEYRKHDYLETTIFHLKAGLKYTVNFDDPLTCDTQLITPEDTFIGNSDLPINIADILSEKPSSQFVHYLGIHPSKKGINTEVWMFPIRTSVGSKTLTAKSVWYFSTSTWSIHDGRYTRIPVRVDLQGTLTNGAQSTFIQQRYDVVAFDSTTNSDVYDISPSWKCPNYSNPNILEVNDTIITLLQVSIPKFNFYENQNYYFYNLSKILSIPASQLNLLKVIGKEDNKSSYILLEIDATSNEQKQLIGQKLVNLIGNSGKSLSVLSQTNTLDVACSGCDHGSCYFGKCLCDLSHTGPNCTKPITRISINRKSLSDYFSGIFLICIAMTILGYFLGYYIYRYYDQLDAKYTNQIGLSKKEIK